MAKIDYPLNKPLFRCLLRSIDGVLSLFFSKRPKQNDQTPKIKRILLSHLGHRGDIILCTAFFPHLKKSFPEVKIGFLLGSWAQEVLENHPDIDFLYTWDHWKTNRLQIFFLKKIYRSCKTKWLTLRKLRKENYDYAIDFSFHFPNAASLFWKARIPYRSGFSSAGFSPLLTHSYAWENRTGPALDSYKTLFSSLFSFPLHSLTPFLPCLKKNAASFPPPGSYLILHMGSDDPKKLWLPSHWSELANKLISEGYQLVLTGKGKEESIRCKTIASFNSSILNLADQLSWEEFVSLIAQAKGLISVDTSAAHIASSFSIPTVVISSGITPYLRWKPAGDFVRQVTYPLPCAPCAYGCKDRICLKNISWNQVYNSFNSLLNP